MITMHTLKITCLSLLFASLALSHVQAQTPIQPISATSNSVNAGYGPEKAIDGNYTNMFSSGINPADDGDITINFASPANMQSVVLYPRMTDGLIYSGFPTSYSIEAIKAVGPMTITQSVGTFSVQPTGGRAVVNFPVVTNAIGLVISPTVPAYDDYDNRFFQLAEVEAFSTVQTKPGREAYSGSYAAPANKQGITDWVTPSAARYSVLRNEFAAGINTHNFFWSVFESSTASSLSPLPCPGGTFMFPADASEKSASGAARYRCMDASAVSESDSFVRQDSSNGLQVAAVIWSAPVQYRYAGCSSYSMVHGPCVPRDDAEDDFEDYVRFLAYRYRPGSSNGKISHFIIWNEAASRFWLDYTPQVSNTNSVSNLDEARIVNKYGRMMARASRAIDNNTDGVMMYASFDKIWEDPNPAVYAGHMGGKDFLTKLFRRIGTHFDWSVAVHPYGEAKDTNASELSFWGVRTILAPFLVSQASLYQTSSGVNPSQWKIIASEQRLKEDLGNSDPVTRQSNQVEEARFVCEAYDETVKSSQIIGVTHFYLQDIPNVPWDPANYAFIPSDIATDFSNASGLPTYEAYRATTPTKWGTASQYCCTANSLGCSSSGAPVVNPPVPGNNNNNNNSQGAQASSQATGLSGWAWSSNIGWISFNSSEGGGGPYSVLIDAATGNWSGHAWSSNIGWIQFGGLGTPPTGGSSDANVNLNNGTVTGWGRALAGVGRTDGWDGWIELSGANHAVTYDSTSGDFSGFAWGGPVVGWIQFDTSVPVTTGPPTPPGTCSDGIDNDGDGLIDAADPDCAGGPGGPEDGGPITSATCSPSTLSLLAVPRNVTFTSSSPVGGSGSYEYSWSGGSGTWSGTNSISRPYGIGSSLGPNLVVRNSGDVTAGSNFTAAPNCGNVKVLAPLGPSNLKIGTTVEKARNQPDATNLITVNQGKNFAVWWNFILTDDYSCNTTLSPNPGFANWTTNWTNRSLNGSDNGDGTITWSGDTKDVPDPSHLTTAGTPPAAPGMYTLGVSCSSVSNPTQSTTVRLRVTQSSETEI